MKRILLVLIMSLSTLLLVSANGQGEEMPKTIVFSDLSWDSVMVHNRIAAYIIVNGMEGNYAADYLAGATIPSITGLVNGDIDINMESWHSNYLEAYEGYISTGKMIDLGPNLPDAPQGWYVPRYIIEGDPERGIEASAPDLKTTDDLPIYAELFNDPESTDKGLIYLGITGWAITCETNEALFDEKGLGEFYNKGIPGSSTALSATMDAAYRKGEGWIGYWWEPTAIMGRLDMVMLEDTNFPPAFVNVLVNSDFAEAEPEIVEFLKKYNTSLEVNNQFLAMMEELETDAQGAAEWFLRNREDVWTQWVDDTVANRVRLSLAE